MIKNKIYFIFIVLFFLTSCGGGLSEEEKNEIENFEKDWTVNSDLADHLELKLDDAEKLIDIPSDSNLLLSDSLENILTVYTEFKASIDQLRSKHSTFMTKIARDNDDWIKFKTQAMKDEKTEDDIQSKIEELRKKIPALQSEIMKLINESEKLIIKIKS